MAFNLGTLGTAKPATTGFTFGIPAASSAAPATNLFGKTTDTAAPTPSLFGGLTASTPAASTPGLFGTTAISTATSKPTLFSAPAASSTAISAPSLFGAPAATTAMGLFGAPAASSVPVAGGLFNLGGITTTVASSTPSLFGSLPIAGPAVATVTTDKKEAAVTLGGIRSDTAKVNGGPKAWKSETVPAPVCKLIDDFKKFLKEQKDLKDEISRFSPASIDKAKEEVEYLTKNVRYLKHSIKTDSAAVSNLKTSVMSELKNCELAQRAKDSTTLEVALPMEYFYKLVYQFEEAIQLYKVQIEEVESVMSCDHRSQDPAYSPQNIGAMLHRMHQIFVTLASKLHGLHEDLKVQKEFYLNYRKVIYKDDSNIFEVRRKNRLTQVCPTPFSDTTNALASLHQVSSATSLTNLTTSNNTNNTTLFGAAPSTSLFGNQSTFTLQPAPLGIKKKR